MLNVAGHLVDYFNGFLPNHVLTVNLNTVKLPLSPMLKSSGRQGHSFVKWWMKHMIKGPTQNLKTTTKSSGKETWLNQIAVVEKISFPVQGLKSKSCRYREAVPTKLLFNSLDK